MTLVLHCFGESGNAWKCALALEMAGMDWRAERVDFFAGATRTPAYRAINPMGEVPALVTPDGTLTQSGVILDWIAERPGPLHLADAAERRAVLRWILFDNHKLSGIAGPLRFNLNFLPEAKRSEGANAFLAMRLASALKILDAHLAEHDWLALGRLTVADLSCAGYLFYPEPYGFERAAHPGIDAWMDRLAAEPGFALPYDLMPRAFPASRKDPT